MSRFGSLIQSFVLIKGLHTKEDFEMPARHQRWAAAEFPNRVAQSRLHLWRPTDPIVARGTRLFVGIATWSGFDLRLLDILDQALQEGTILDDHIDVFNCFDQDS